MFLFFCLILGFPNYPIFAADEIKKTAIEGPESDAGGFNLNLYIENDSANVGGPGSDSNYTNGIRLSFLYAPNKEPSWIKLLPAVRDFFEGYKFNFGLGLGQKIYTPEDINRSDLISNEMFKQHTFASITLTYGQRY